MEIPAGLLRRKPQIFGADLDDLAPCSQAGQRQRRVGAAGDHKVHPRRQMVKQEGHVILNVARVDDVVVVEHQYDLVVRDGAELIEQQCEDCFNRRGLR
jgi:hypothetical protein